MEGSAAIGRPEKIYALRVVSTDLDVWVAYGLGAGEEGALRLLVDQDGRVVSSATIEGLTAHPVVEALSMTWTLDEGAVVTMEVSFRVPRAGVGINRKQAAALWNAWSFADDVASVINASYEFRGRIADLAPASSSRRWTLSTGAVPRHPRCHSPGVSAARWSACFSEGNVSCAASSRWPPSSVRARPLPSQRTPSSSGTLHPCPPRPPIR